MAANKQFSTYDMVATALFIAIIFLLNVTPLGYIRLPLIAATTIHIPIIVGSIILGPKIGAVLGLCFGATSLWGTFTAPSALSFIFSPFISGSGWSLFICFVPRILLGIIPYFIYKLYMKITGGRFDVVGLGVAGALSTALHTLMVMNLAYLFFGERMAEAFGVAVNAVYAVVVTIMVGNGVPEAIVGTVFAMAVCKPLLILRKKRNSNA